MATMCTPLLMHCLLGWMCPRSDMTASSGRSEDFYYEQSRLRGESDGMLIASPSGKPSAKSPSRTSAASGAKSPTVQSPLTPCTGQAGMDAPLAGSPPAAEADSKMVQSPSSPLAQSPQPPSAHSQSSSPMIQSPKPPSPTSDASQVKQG